jgi:hypothetical protein
MNYGILREEDWRDGAPLLERRKRESEILKPREKNNMKL